MARAITGARRRYYTGITPMLYRAEQQPASAVPPLDAARPEKFATATFGAG